MTNNIIQLPLQAPVELELVDAIKTTIYGFSGRVTMAQVVGCLKIAGDEIDKEHY